MPAPKTRREFLHEASGLTAAALFAAPALSEHALPTRRPAAPSPSLASVHAGGSDTIQLALIGCGGRGSGAAENALAVKQGPVRVIAMADVFEDRLRTSHNSLTELDSGGFDVTPDRRFIGFDGYRHAMDLLRPGDIAILTTPPAFRWVHFQYAIEKGLHVFMEKPVCVDGPTGRRMIELAARADEKNLKVGVGLMSRHSRAMQELAQRVQDGELGEIIAQHGYRMQGNTASFRSTPAPPGVSPLHHQIRRFHSFLWTSGGAYNDYFIHLIDHLCWMKDPSSSGNWPVKANALGGRHYRTASDGTPFIDQNFDTYAVEYTYADGTQMIFNGRNIDGAATRYHSFMHGTKASAIVSAHSDCGLPSSIHSSRDLGRASATWRSNVPEDQRNPYQNEWEALVAAIHNDTPFNEAKRGAEASMVCNMGRMAAHTGREITFDEMLNCEHEFAPMLADLTMDSPSPLPPDAEGRVPVPQPGIVTEREY
jgi:predicted dehydrogenase